MDGVLGRWLAPIALGLMLPVAVDAGQREEIGRARALYNQGAYNAAIKAATAALGEPALESAARLVLARARLERFRQTNEGADLDAARLDLMAVDARALTPRDRVEFEIGLGEALFLSGSHGAAAELFDGVLSRAALAGPGAAERVLDWWASSVDREARTRAPEARATLYNRILQRMEEKLRENPACGPASYWLVVAARGLGQLERAWNAAIAGWLRAPFTSDRGASLRADLDRLVRDGLVPERARQSANGRAAADAETTLLAEWQAVKDRWSRP